MSWKLTAKAATAPNLNCTERCVLMLLCHYANQQQETFPSLKLLMKQAMLSKPTVIKTIRSLVSKNLIEKTDRKAGKTSSIPVYFVNFNLSEKVIHKQSSELTPCIDTKQKVIHKRSNSEGEAVKMTTPYSFNREQVLTGGGNSKIQLDSKDDPVEKSHTTSFSNFNPDSSTVQHSAKPKDRSFLGRCEEIYHTHKVDYPLQAFLRWCKMKQERNPQLEPGMIVHIIRSGDLLIDGVKSYTQVKEDKIQRIEQRENLRKINPYLDEALVIMSQNAALGHYDQALSYEQFEQLTPWERQEAYYPTKEFLHPPTESKTLTLHEAEGLVTKRMNEKKEADLKRQQDIERQKTLAARKVVELRRHLQ